MCLQCPPRMGDVSRHRPAIWNTRQVLLEWDSSSDQAVVVEMTKVPLGWNLSGQSPRSGHSWRERATRIPSQFDSPPRCMLWMVETKENIPTGIKPSFWDTEQMKGKLVTALCEPWVCWSHADSWERHAVPLGTLCCLTAYLIAQKLP